MRIGFFGQTGPYAPPALRVLLAARRSFDIALVVEGRKAVAGRGGTHQFYRPEKGPLPDGEDLVALATAADLPAFSTSDINGDGALRVLEKHALDLIVCVGFDRLFSPAVLATARRGGVNAHPSRLPELRGPSPIFWALRRGARDLVLTLHALDAREDHGVIYAQESFVLPRRAGGDEIYAIAGDLAGRMLVPLLERACQGELTGTIQDDRLATRAPRPKPEDAFVKPEEWAAEHLVDFCCGAPFFKTPWMRLGDEVFFVRQGLRAELGKRLPAHYVVHGERLVVQCKDGLAHLVIQTEDDVDP